MCLLVFGWRAHPKYTLVFAGNRDEFHTRPTIQAGWWGDPPEFLAGQDLQAGGTWLGVSKRGKFAVVTNYREGAATSGELSRGALVTAYARHVGTADGFTRELKRFKDKYAGYNLIFGDQRALHYYSNRAKGISPLDKGIYGLSNHELDHPWPKLRRTRERFVDILKRSQFEAEDFFTVLKDRAPAKDDELPDTGIGEAKERLLSSPFIVSPQYGTRSSTVVLIEKSGRCIFKERSYAPDGYATRTEEFDFRLGAE